MPSYRKKSIKGRIHKVKPKKSIFRRSWFWITILFLIIVLSTSYLFIFYSGVQVKNIIVSGNQKVSNKDIENLVLENINIKIFGIRNWTINSKSIFLINSDKLNKEILNNFPTIESVKIDRKFMQTLDVHINERAPVAVFCPTLSKNNCYLLDENGIIFEPISLIPQNMIIMSQEMNGQNIYVGEKVVAQNIMDLLSKAQKDLKDSFQINITQAIVASSIKLDVTTNENWQIYFDLSPDVDINTQLQKLNLLLSGGVSGDERKKLRYINLIPKDKAIICDNSICGG